MKFWMINYNKSNYNDPIQIAPAKSARSHQQEMIYGASGHMLISLSPDLNPSARYQLHTSHSRDGLL